ncbi:MAG: MFS transporter [Spirochaetaceae bacterium]|jgi:PPP family 3-phenylpropionic acid transporter|nr:MFS transporter [Spirochaetaceae bacterium]
MRLSAVVLCAVVFTAYATISPYLAILVRSLGFSQGITGLLLGAAEISAIAAPFLFGAWADRRGDYKTAFLAVIALWIVSGAAILLFKNPLASALFVPFLAVGYRATVPLSDAVITVNIGRTGNYGKIRASGSIVFVLVVLALQATPVYRPMNAHNIVFWNLISVTALLAVVLCLPKSFLRPARRPALVNAALAPKRHVKKQAGKGRSIWTPAFIVGIAVIFLNRLAFSPIQTYISLYTVEYLQWDAVGLVVAISAFSEAPFILLSNKILNRWAPNANSQGLYRLLALTTAAVAVRLLCLALFPSKIVLVMSQLLHSLTFGVFHPAAIAFVVANVPPEKRAVGMTVYMSLGTGFPTFLGNIAGGIIIEHAGYRALFGGFILFALLALLMYGVFGRKMRGRG